MNCGCEDLCQRLATERNKNTLTLLSIQLAYHFSCYYHINLYITSDFCCIQSKNLEFESVVWNSKLKRLECIILEKNSYIF